MGLSIARCLQKTECCGGIRHTTEIELINLSYFIYLTNINYLHLTEEQLEGLQIFCISFMFELRKYDQVSEYRKNYIVKFINYHSFIRYIHVPKLHTLRSVRVSTNSKLEKHMHSTIFLVNSLLGMRCIAGNYATYSVS